MPIKETRGTLKIQIYGLLLVLVFIPGCFSETCHLSKLRIGTLVNITAAGPNARQAVEAAFEEIERIESVFSPYKKESDIQRINSTAWQAPVKVKKETMDLLKRSIRISEETSGAFDPSFAGISHLWNFRDKNFYPPSKEKVSSLLPLVDYRKIRLNADNNCVMLGKKSMKISLGGIAKGYAIERAMMVLKDKGISAGIVDAGGDLQVLGMKEDRLWKTGLVHPRSKEVILSLDMKSLESIATSGDYERFVMYKGKRYHHIIDPETGYPASGLASVSVLTHDPVRSDALATAFFVMGVEKVREYLRKNRDVFVILIDRNMKIYISSELKDRLDFFTDTRIEWM